MRCLVLAGGGSKGAFAVGVLEALSQAGITWDVVIGCSTGALIAPSLALDDIATLTYVYSHVTNADIYRERAPVEWVAHQSLYDWMPLWGFINRQLPFNAYERLVATPMAVYLLTTYMQGGCGLYWATQPPAPRAGYRIEAIDSHLTLTRAMLASASQPVLFPLVEIRDGDHQQYCDGGVVAVAPVGLASALGAEIIDVILLSPPDEAPPVQTVYTAFLGTLARTVELMIESSTAKDIAMVQQLAPQRTVHLIQPQSLLTENSLRFEPEEMRQMMDLGRIAGEVALHEWGKQSHAAPTL